MKTGDWQSAVAFRYQYSDRHFTGHREEPDRQEEGSEVKNTYYLFDFAISRAISNRSTITASLPFVIAERSQLSNANPDDPGERNETGAEGIGDFTMTARRWMLKPETHPTGNYQLGFGIKLPTGDPNAFDTFKTSNGLEQRHVDQSIQPGDGGFGFLIDFAAFGTIGDFGPYLTATYLFNPEETSGVETYRSRETEALMSISDQYIARAGVQWACADNWALGLGGRIEGVPVEDVFGGSQGFRRPGYAISVEPSAAYTWGKEAQNTVSLSVPIAVVRNRQRSVPDKEEPGRHGDAAFADWFLLLGWTYRF